MVTNAFQYLSLSLTFLHLITLLWNKQQKHFCGKSKSKAGHFFSCFPGYSSCDDHLIANSSLYVHSSFFLFSFSSLHQNEAWQKWKLSSHLGHRYLRDCSIISPQLFLFCQHRHFQKNLGGFPVCPTAWKTKLIQRYEIKQQCIQKKENVTLPCFFHHISFFWTISKWIKFCKRLLHPPSSPSRLTIHNMDS